MVNMQIEGFEELKNDFRKYGIEAEKAIKRGIDRTAIACETDAKRRLAGELGGKRRIKLNRLRASVHAELGKNTSNPQQNTFRPDKNSKPEDGEFGIAIAKDEAYVGTNVEYGSVIEYGSPGHDIFPKNVQALHWRGEDGEDHFAGKVSHPGFAGMSFMGFAAVNQQTKLTGRVTEELNKLIE